MSGRNSQVSRIYAILDILEGAPQGLSVTEICERAKDRNHEASVRTVYRDLEALAAAGFPLFPTEEGTDNNAKRWKLERLTKVHQHFVLSWRELLALFLARGALIPLKDTPFYADLNAIFQKIEERLGTRNQEYFKELAAEIQFEPGPRWGLGIDPDLLETVRACCSERQVLKVGYTSAGAGIERERRLGPHFLYFAKGSLYLVAEDIQKQQVKVYSLARMREAQMLPELYEGKITDPETYFKTSFGVFHGGAPQSVKIEFSNKVSPFVKERRWHESQRLVSRADGTILLSLDVAITPELVQWVLGFGSEARVMEPTALSEKLTESAQGIIALYRKQAA